MPSVDSSIRSFLQLVSPQQLLQVYEQEILRRNISALREEHAKRGFATRMVWTRRPDVVRAVWLEGGNRLLINFCKPNSGRLRVLTKRGLLRSLEVT
jgi:hypothetical protein